MSEYVKIPREAFSLIEDKDLWQLYGYLLSKADKDGVIETSLSTIQRDLRVSQKTLRNMLAKLKRANLGASEGANKGTKITLYECVSCATQRASKRANDGASKRASENQPQTAPIIASVTATTTVQNGFERFLEYFNEKVAYTPIKQIRTLSNSRKNALRAIFKEFGGKEVVEEALDKVIVSRWCCGENDKGWVASFDWIFKKSNFIKILEGNYDNRSITATNQQQSSGSAFRRETDRYTELDEAADTILRNAPYFNATQND